MMAAGKPLVEVALWLLVLCSGINAAFGSANKETKGVVLCNERERQALLKFKHALNVTNDALPSWVGDNCSRWEGVRCNSETGHVIKLKLHGTIITDSGEIDSSLLELKHLRYLDLSGNYFGYKPIPKFFGSFLKLRFLYLSDATFSGTVPWQIGNISSLRYLDLSDNPFLQIENLQWLSHLSSLQYLDLRSVNLSMVADWVQPINVIPSLSVLRLSGCGLRSSSTPLHLNLTSLTVLDLSFNKLTGDLNGFLTSLIRCGANNLEKLSRLYLSNNNFSGTIPESLGQLSNLVSMKMSYNSLEGAISEAHFTNLTRLEELDLSANSLFFNVSPHWIPPFQLQSIELSSCQLGPQFPTWLQFQRNLSYLDLSHSQISDVIPNWFWTLLSQVSYLNISQNLISGKIPSVLNFYFAVVDFNSNQFVGPLPQNWSGLDYLDLSNNLLSGPLDMSIEYISFLFLSNNSLHGSIPSSICNCSSIYMLALSRNNLTGQVPSCFEDLHLLSILDLSYNNLDGPIPNIFSYHLVWLQLGHNNLSGVLPSSIGVQSRLLALDLSGNRLSGSIPRWLGENTSRLVILNLRSNMFDGNIPPQLSLLSSLQILALAKNRLSGEIPTSFGNFTSMAMTGKLIYSIFGEYTIAAAGGKYWTWIIYREYVTVIMKGIEMKYTKALTLVTIMDLSSNNLSGEIPQELTSLRGLQSLNLSGNHLEGKIPKEIGSLMQLESLDLSQNHLSGAIPSSISSLTFLSKLNLSNNNLSGTIPLGNQLQTLLDPSIYAGNYDLCGPPLPKLCSADVVPQPPSTFHDEDEKDGTEHWWFFIGVAPGFVAGFWLVCGILIFSKSWRIAYFSFFDRLNERLDGFYVKMVATVMKKIKG